MMEFGLSWMQQDAYELQGLQVLTQLLLAGVAFLGVLVALFVPFLIRKSERNESERRFQQRCDATTDTLVAELKSLWSECASQETELMRIWERLNQPNEPIQSPGRVDSEQMYFMELPAMPLLGSPAHWCVYLSREQADAVSSVNGRLEALHAKKKRYFDSMGQAHSGKVALEMKFAVGRLMKDIDAALASLR